MDSVEDGSQNQKVSLVSLSPEKKVIFSENSINSREAKLAIKNVSDGIVAFKLKTTSPKTYLVKPSSGVIPRGEHAHVKVIFQPAWGSDESAAPGSGHGFNNKDRAHDKFLLQCRSLGQVALPGAPRDMWHGVDKKDVEETRLGVHISTDDCPKPDNNGSTIYAPSPQFLSQMKELQRENFKLSQEVEHLKQTILSIQSVEDSSKGFLSHIKPELWHIPLLLVGIIVAWYFFSKSNTQEL